MTINWARRSLGVAASEIAAIVGVDEFTGPELAWERKVSLRSGVIPGEIENEDIERGNALEGAVREWVNKRTGLDFKKPDGTYECRTQNGMLVLASPDGVLECDVCAREPTTLLEIKCPRYGNHVRLGWEFQCQWQIMVLSKCGLVVKKVILAVFSDGRLEMHDIYPDEQLQKDLVNAAENWWVHVLNGTRPDPMGAESASWLRENIKQAKDDMIDSEDIASVAVEYERWKAIEKDAAEHKEELAAKLQSRIDTNKGVKGSWGRATWTTVNKTTVDWKGVAEASGATEEDIARYTRSSQYRQLRVKLSEGKE